MKNPYQFLLNLHRLRRSRNIRNSCERCHDSHLCCRRWCKSNSGRNNMRNRRWCRDCRGYSHSWPNLVLLKRNFEINKHVINIILILQHWVSQSINLSDDCRRRRGKAWRLNVHVGIRMRRPYAINDQLLGDERVAQQRQTLSQEADQARLRRCVQQSL